MDGMLYQSQYWEFTVIEISIIEDPLYCTVSQIRFKICILQKVNMYGTNGKAISSHLDCLDQLSEWLTKQ